MKSKKLRKLIAKLNNKPRAKASRKGAVKSVTAPQPLKLIAGGKAPAKIRPETVARARAAVAKPTARVNPFEVYMPPPGVLPKDVKPIAMDSAMTQSQINWASQSIGVYWQEGLTFLGYAYLSELTLRPEYRTISQVIATEMTRKWIKLQAVSEAEEQEVPDSKIPPKEPKAPFPPQFGASDAAPEDEEEQDRDQAEAGEADPQEKDQDQEEAGASFDPQAQETGEVDAPSLGHNQGPALNDKGEKIKELEDELDRLHVRDIFYKLAELDGWMGRAHLYIDTGATDDPVELKTDLGDGRNEATKGKFKKGMLERLTVVEPVWTYPQNYNSNDPLKPDWYNPTQWFVMGKQLHASRLLTFVGRPVPDILKPAYAFGGLSLSQIAKPYVDNWLQTRASVNDIIRAFSVMVVATDLTARLQNGDDDLFARIDLFNALRDNRGTFVIDKEGEDFKNVSAPLSSLDKLQAQAQEHMGSVTRIPLVKLLGISPAGLNASSEGELKTFYDTINAFQESFFRPHLTKVIHFAMMNLWGEIDEEITFKFEDLWAMTEKEQAEVEKIRAETGDILINGSNAITPAEERKRVANTAETPYEGIDVENVPEPPEQPMLGGEGEGGEKSLGLTGHKPFQGGETGESAEQNAKEGEAGDDRVVPFGEDAQWNESDHPRNEDGEFSSSGSGGGSSKAESGASSGGTEHAATAGTKLINLIKNDPFLGKHATSDDYYGNAAVRKEKDGSVSVSMRDVGKWVNPPDRSDEEDYDWQVPTPESVTKLKQLVAKAEKDLGVKIEISGGEKNWTTFRIKPSVAPKAAAKPAAMPTLDPKTLKKVGPQMGSNPGGVYQNKQGEMFHVKQGRSPAHVRNEALAARLYGLTGASTLQYLNAGKNHIATKLEKLDKKRVKDLSPDEIKAAQKDFVTHAWLANWDAAGLGGDNIGTIKGKPVSLDLGGALEYRARGAPKGQAFGNTVGELKTLRDPKMNPDAAVVFGGMSKADLEASAKPVLEVPDQEIRKAVESEGGSPDLAAKLIARKRDIAKSLGLSAIVADQAVPGEGGLPGQIQGRSARPGAQDAWSEADHPRVPSGPQGGQFTSGGGGGGGGSTPGEQGTQAAKAEGKTAKAKEALELAAQNILEISGQSGAEVASEVPAQLWAEQKFAAAKSLNLTLAEATDLLTPEEHASLTTSEFETPEGLWDYIGEEEEQVAEYEKEQAASAKAEGKGGAYAGQYVTGGTPEQNHKATVDKVLNNPTQKGIHYRRMLAKLIKESKQFGTGEALQDALTQKLIGALDLTAKGLIKKGKTTEAHKVITTLHKMGASEDVIVPLESMLDKGMSAPATSPTLAPKKKTTPQVKAPAGSTPLGLPPAETPSLAAPTKPTGKATQSELNAAKKASAYYPAPTSSEGKKIAAEFNEKYQNKQLTDPAALEQKVVDYKETKAKIEKAEQAAQAEMQKKAQAEAAAQAVKQAEEAKKQAEANKQVMKDLGINEQEAVGFNALAQMIGGKKADVVKTFQKYEEEAKSLGYPITGFQAALIKNYSGSGYAHINPHLRNGSWTEAQHVYVKMVNNALKKMPTYKGVCRRGTSLASEHQAKYKVGHIVPENAFMSTTTKGEGFSGNTRYVITAIGKRGASIKQLSSHPSENEVLFAARTFFKVTKVEGSPGGQMTVHLEEMDDD